MLRIPIPITVHLLLLFQPVLQFKRMHAESIAKATGTNSTGITGFNSSPMKNMINPVFKMTRNPIANMTNPLNNTGK